VGVTAVLAGVESRHAPVAGGGSSIAALSEDMDSIAGAEAYYDIRGDRDPAEVAAREFEHLEGDPRVFAGAMAEWLADARGDAISAMEEGGFARWIPIVSGGADLDGHDYAELAEQNQEEWSRRELDLLAEANARRAS
jgi:hypothetical protein